jgi:replicative DNA helicase
MTLKRQLPSSLEAEQALLSSMMVYPSTVSTVIELGLKAEDFYAEAHKRLFQVIMSMADEGKPIDAVSLISRCNDLKVLNAVGGVNMIMELADTSVSGANTKYYVELIQNKAYLRNLISASQQITEEGFNTEADIDEVMDRAEKQILNVTRTRRTAEFRDAKEIVGTVLENIQKMSAQHSNLTGTTSGYRRLDRITNGFQRGDLILLAARPSMGKTAFALNVALNAAQGSDKAVALFSLEMPAEQLITRMLSVKSRINGSDLRTGQFKSNQQWNALNEAAADLKNTKIYIDDSPSIRVAEIFSKCRKLQSEHALSLIVIDYIQLITGSGKNSSDNRQQEVSEISRALKALARELEVPVLALSQLSRMVEQRAGNKPQLSDLRESGSLEQDADIVLFLYRESYYKREEEEKATEVTEVLISKHRNGATGSINLAFERSINAFYNISEPASGQSQAE